MKCKICGSESSKLFNKKILNKYRIDYFKCPNCDFIQTEDPYWLDEAYKEPINTSDTGLLNRNIYLSKISAILIFLNFNSSGVYLDFAGGYGVFTRLMRDYGFDFFWHDPFTVNLFAKGFEWENKSSKKVELSTTFESFEHFKNPIEEIEKTLKISDNILFSTQLIPIDIDNWWYLATHHGQHIAFYSKRTLSVIANKYNLFLYTNNKNIHLFTKKKRIINIKLIQLFSVFKLDCLIKLIIKSKMITDSNLMKKNDFGQ